MISEETGLPIQKPLDYKTYNSIGHLSGSRLGPKDRHIDKKQEEYLTIKFPEHQKCFLYIEEKMDGSNVTVVRLNGELVALGRSGYKCETSNQEQHRMFARYVQNNLAKFDKLLPNEHDRVVGEWMALAHGTIYKSLAAPFMAFDLYLNKVQQSVTRRQIQVFKAGLENVPSLWASSNSLSIDKALNLCSKNAEGVIYRLEKIQKKNDRAADYIPWIIAKVVRLEKEDGKYLEDELIWNYREPKDNEPCTDDSCC